MNASDVLKRLIDRFCNDPYAIPRTANVKLCFNDDLDSGFTWGDIIHLERNPEQSTHTAEPIPDRAQLDDPGASSRPGESEQ